MVILRQEKAGGGGNNVKVAKPCHQATWKQKAWQKKETSKFSNS